MFELPPLPYALDALEPHISRETLEYHYGKHHQSYVNNLNNIITAWHDLENASLEDVIKNSHGWVFNNAAQIWNHTFYWNCLSPNGWWSPSWKLAGLIVDEFESIYKFKEAFNLKAISNFGSGWTWLALTPDNRLEIISTDDAKTLVNTDNKPLLVVDVWEHAYYIDHRNARPKYLDVFWNLVNWDFVEKNL
jgi:superoxide dismutase, Fe-Mn family